MKTLTGGGPRSPARDRRRDRQLPRRGAPRRRPRSGTPTRAGSTRRSRARPRVRARTRAVAARSRPRRHLRPRHLRPRRAARAGALSQRGVPPRAGRPRRASCGASATGARRPGRCVPLALPSAPPDECTYDATNLPLPVAPLDPSFTCVPDPLRGIECEPQVTLRIPVKLGPRTVLYDLGVHRRATRSPRRASPRATELVLGEPGEHAEARGRAAQARRALQGGGVRLRRREVHARVVGRSHARARPLRHRRGRPGHRRGRFVIRGNERTNDWTIRRRIALELGQAVPHERRAQDAGAHRDAQRVLERQRRARGAVRPAEEQDRHRDGDGAKPAVDRGARPASRPARASAASSTTRTRTSAATPSASRSACASRTCRTSLIFDPVVKQNFDSLCGTRQYDRVLQRPAPRAADHRDVSLPRDRLRSARARARSTASPSTTSSTTSCSTSTPPSPASTYRPFRELQFALAQTLRAQRGEHLRRSPTISDLPRRAQPRAPATGDTPTLATLLRFPDVPEPRLRAALRVTWDRRDNTFNPHKRHAPRERRRAHRLVRRGCRSARRSPASPAAAPRAGTRSASRETFAAYLPVTKTITLAAELRTGLNVAAPERTRRPTPTASSSSAASSRCAATCRTAWSRRRTPTTSQTDFNKAAQRPDEVHDRRRRASAAAT